MEQQAAVRRTAVSQLQLLRDRFFAESARWPSLRHRIQAFLGWTECKRQLELNPSSFGRVRKTDIKDQSWSSHAEPGHSQHWILGHGRVFVLGEFFLDDTNLGDTHLEDGIARFSTLGEQTMNALIRTGAILSEVIPRQLDPFLLEHRPDVPVQPWLAFVYDVILNFYTPEILGSVLQGRSREHVGKYQILETGKPDEDFKTLDDAMRRQTALIAEGRNAVMRYTASSRELHTESLESGDRLLQQIWPNGNANLRYDVFSTSGTVLNQVCSWLNGESSPVVSPFESDDEGEFVSGEALSLAVYSDRQDAVRDALFLHWSEHDSLKQGEIAEKWKNMSVRSRREISPDNHGRVTADVVKTARRKAREDKKAKKVHRSVTVRV